MFDKALNNPAMTGIAIPNFAFCSLANISPTIGVAFAMACAGVVISFVWTTKMG